MHVTALPLFQTFSGNTWTGFSQTDSSFAFISLEVGDIGSPTHIGKAKLEYLLSHGISPAQTNQVKTAIHLTINGNKVQVSLHGDASLLIIRNGKYTEIKRSTMGQLQEGDVLILTNQQTVESQTWSDIKTNLSSITIEVLERKFLNEEKNPHIVLISINSLDISMSKKSQYSSVPLHTKAKLPKINSRFLVLIPILIFALAFGIKQTTSVVSYSQAKTELEDVLTQAEGIYPLSPASAQTGGQKAQILLDTIKSQKIEPWQDEFQTRINRIASKPAKLAPTTIPTDATGTTKPSNSGSLGDAQPYFDATSINLNSNYSRLVSQDNKLFLLDTVAKRLDSLQIDTKESANLIKNNSLETVQLLASNASGIFVANNTNLYKVDSSSLTSVLKFSSTDSTVSPTSLAFWNNALYVLDSQNRQVYKYTPNTKGFDPAVAWVKEGQKLESDAVSITIDTNLYLLSKTNLISEFQKGERTKFALSGVTGVDSPTHLVVPIAGDKLILTAANKVFIFDKTGKLSKTYSLGDTIPLDIAYFNNTLYILDSTQKIIKLPL